MTDNSEITNNYGRNIQSSFALEFIDLTHKGSAYDGENQLVVMTIDENHISTIRTAYRRNKPHGIKDFEVVRNNDGTADVYFGGSYGASELLSGIGSVLYNSDLTGN